MYRCRDTRENKKRDTAAVRLHQVFLLVTHALNWDRGVELPAIVTRDGDAAEMMKPSRWWAVWAARLFGAGRRLSCVGGENAAFCPRKRASRENISVDSLMSVTD